MNPIIIERTRDISNIDVKLKKNKPIIVFDIHKTTLLKSEIPDREVKKYVKQFLKHKYNVIFLSYDGNDKRIIHNNMLINKVSLYTNIPRIFIKKRKKHLVLKHLTKQLYKISKNNDMKYYSILIDDNINNINDVLELKYSQILAYYYTKNNRYNGNNSLDKLSLYFPILALSKDGNFIY